MKSVLSYLGALLQIFALFLIIPAGAAFIYGEDATPYFITLTLSLVGGIYLDKNFKRKEITLGDGLLLTALSFLLFSLLGALPYFLVMGPSFPVINSLFESVSGITTTGLTVFDDVESLPKSLLMWRSLTQWLGGIGIVIIFLSVLRGLQISSINLYSAQGFREKIESSVLGTAKKMVFVYSLYTFFGIVLLSLAGLTFFEAVNTALAAISTGGFAVVNNFFTETKVLAVVSLLMVLGSMSFVLHSKLFRRRVRSALKNPEFKFFLLLLALFSSAAFLFTGSAKISLFEILSALTTTGFSITEQSALPPFLMTIVILSMYIGASSGSTGGGLKLIRFLTMLKTIPWVIRKSTKPRSAVIPLKIEREAISSEILQLVGIFVFVYTFMLFLGFAAMLLYGYSPSNALFQVGSALGTVGLSTVNISAAPSGAKLLLMLFMLLGRLEILPFFILASKLFSRG